MANDEKNKGNSGAKKRGFDSSTLPMELGSDMKKFLSGYADKMKKCADTVESKKKVSGSRDNGNGDKESNVTVDASEKESSVIQGESSNRDMEDDETCANRKRKRECYKGMLDWIRTVAKDPCHPAIGSMPESDKWKDYGADLPWKQALLTREAVLLQTKVDTSSQKLAWERIQKMHPAMYDDLSGPLRSSQRIATVKNSSRKEKSVGTPESSSSGDQNKRHTDIYSESYSKREEIPIGPHFQAELPEFVGAAEYQSHSKWVGTRVWPLAKGEKIRALIERDPIGKGRQESCGCQFQGSLECMRFHINEKRNKVKLELGTAFYLWKFDRMGEDVALNWNKEDEAKFQDIVKNNQLSMGKSFWDELFRVFSRKGREALVSYYFNAFLLRRRADQNRTRTSKFDSDDDESEYGPTANRFGHTTGLSPSSIFRSPKRPHLSRR